MNTETAKKEERSEYVGLYVTPKTAKLIEEAKDNRTIKETIVRQMLESEVDFMKEEMREIDEQTIKYKAKLIGIRENFAEANHEHTAEIDKIWAEATKKFKSVDKLSSDLQKKIDFTADQVRKVSDSISNINYSNLERFLDQVERFNKMNETEKELVKMLIEKS